MAEDLTSVSQVQQQKALYKVEAFDCDKAKDRKLCTVVDSNGDIVGTGIPTYKNDTFIITINGIQYMFNSYGDPDSQNAKDAGYSLKMGTSNLVGIAKGTVGTTKSAFTRTINSETGEIKYTPSESSDNTYEISIEDLNARDQFAIQVLRGMLDKIDDPSVLTKDEITYYCTSAYQWASYMMETSSKSRAVIKDAENSSSTKVEEVGILDTNTERLLNNIVAALDKTDEKETKTVTTVNGGTALVDIYSERISIPKLIDWLNAYSAHTPDDAGDIQTTVGLDDLIKAIKAINVNIDFTSIVNAIGALGQDADHPIHITGGGFPTRDALAAVFDATALNDFLTFNESGAVGHTTKEETKKAILGYLNDYADTNALGTAIYNSIQTTINNRIKAWLQAAKVHIGDTDYTITVNTPT